MLFESVASLSGTESGSADSKQPPRKKQKREPVAAKVTAEYLQNLVARVCPCQKRLCLKQFSKEPLFSKLLEYRRVWFDLGKIDEDAAFESMRELIRDAGEDSYISWLWEAARDGEAAAPVDLRYLKRPNSRVMTDDAASTRGDIFSFLQYVYESQAETLPDFRDELKEELGAVTTIDLSTEDPYVVEMQHETKQTLRAVALGRHLRARAEQQTHYWRHLKAQYSDRLQYYRLRALSRLREEGTICLIQDGMDQSKVSVPRHPAVKGKEFSTMMKPKCHVSLTLVHGFLLLYALSNPDTSKDSNMTIETLAHTLTVLVKEFRVDLTQVHLCIQVDNTCREAKNNMVLRWCAAQVSCGNVKSISLNSLRSGHSHEDVDQCFGQLARCIARHKRAATPDHFMQIVGDFAKGMHRPHEEGRYTVKVDDARDWNPAQHFITILESVCVVLTPSFGLVVSDAKGWHLAAVPVQLKGVGGPVVAEKRPIAEDYKSHLQKFLSLLRAPVYKLEEAADWIEAWLNGTLPPTPLLSIDAYGVPWAEAFEVASAADRAAGAAMPPPLRKGKGGKGKGKKGVGRGKGRG
ncbi:Uncharacterized protein SCF082_LOCUS38861 [Durusdinium trenchii]|uniref:DUF7869 domain-containing protein n=1 Tax=Durusdinium trenchii TaxID=1381693 RepID=A0ABP0Q0F1_9DINO